MLSDTASQSSDRDNHRVNEESATPGTYYFHARPEVLELVPLSARKVLDVGCGAGGLSENLKARQPVEVHGVELVAQAAELARNHLDQVWHNTIEDALPNLPDGYYDCIVIADVLEHLLDPWTVLSDIKNKLAAGGKIVASIPNIQNWDVLSNLIQGKWDYRNEGILDRTHLRFFTRKSVEELFLSAGLRIETLTTAVRGSAPPPKLLKELKNAGLSNKELTRDGHTFQFLVEAVAPAPETKPKIAIIILNWNGKEDTLECLESVQKIDYHNFETVVVDNGSSDGSVPIIKERFPDIVVLESENNLGYAGGNNLGIHWALDHGTDYILLLNNDTIVDPDLLKAFHNASQIVPDAGVFGARIYLYNRPDTLWYAGARWLPDRMCFEHIGFNQKDGPEFSLVANTDYVTGCALFTKSEVFQSIGLLDEDFYLTFEESDWCYRAREAGYRNMYVPSAKLWHKVSVSFGGAESPLYNYFMTRNRFLWARKHLPYKDRLVLFYVSWKSIRSTLLPVFVLGSHPASLPKRIIWGATTWLRALKRNLNIPANRATLYGLRDYILGRFGDCPRIIRQLSSKPNNQA